MTCCSKWFRLALWGVVAAVASVASPGTASASEKGTLTVKDNGSVFTADGVRKAEEAFEGVTFQAPTKLAVVTFGKIPEAKRAAFDAVKSSKEDKDRFFGEWAKEIARSSGKPDVLVLVSMEGTSVKVIDDRQTDLKRGFDDKDVRTVRDKFMAGFKPVAGEENDAKLARHDAALLESVKFVAAELKDTTVPANTKRANGAGNNVAESKGTGIMGYICIGIVVLLGIWLVIGVVRMMMGGGGGGGGGGYGGGGMGGGGMGGGGGLMTGLLGGMLGAVAGNYLYNNFMGGNTHSNDMGSSGGYGDSGTSGDTGAGDYDGGADSGNGDFGGGDAGGSSGGGDSGGGDFGGGDTGGGGDSGGGDW